MDSALQESLRLSGIRSSRQSAGVRVRPANAPSPAPRSPQRLLTGSPAQHARSSRSLASAASTPRTPRFGSPGVGAEPMELLPLQKEYAKMCAGHTGVAIDQPVMDALSSLHLHVHLDQYSANDLKVFFQIMKKAGNFKSIKLSLGQTSLDLTMKRKLNRMGTEGPAINNKSNAARLSSMVAKVMRRSPDVTAVEAIGISFSAESVGRIAKATFACPKLKRLSFSQCRIGDRGFSNVSDAIRVSTSIMDLDISDCQLGDKSIGAVSTILKQHNASRNEDRWAYSLRDDPVNVSLNGLLFVDLSNNAVSDRGAAALAAFLPQDNWLQALCLRNNELTDSGIASLFEGLANHDQLFVIDVRNNTLAPPEAIAQLEDACAERLLPPRSSHPHLWAVLERWGWPHMVEKPVLRRRASRRRRKARSSARAVASTADVPDDADSGFGADPGAVNVTEAQLSEWEAHGRSQAQEAVRAHRDSYQGEGKGYEQDVGADEYDVGEDWLAPDVDPVVPPPAPPVHDRPGSGAVRMTQASPPPVPPPGAYKQVVGRGTTSGRKKHRASSSRRRTKSSSKGRGRRRRSTADRGASGGEDAQGTTADAPARDGSRLRRAASARLHQSTGHDGLGARGLGRDLDPAAARDWDSDGDVSAAAMELMFDSLVPGSGGYGPVGSPKNGTDLEGQVAAMRVALRHSKTALLKAEGERLAVLEENARLRQQVADTEALIKAQAQAASAVRSSPRRSPTSNDSKGREHSRARKARGGSSSGRTKRSGSGSGSNSTPRARGSGKSHRKRAEPEPDLDSAVALMAAATTRASTDDMLNKLESTVGRLVKFMANIEQQRDDVGASSGPRRSRGSASKHRTKSSKSLKHRSSASGGLHRTSSRSKKRRSGTRATAGGGATRDTASPRASPPESPRRQSRRKATRGHSSAATNGNSGAAKQRSKSSRRPASKRTGAGTGGSGVGADRDARPTTHEELLRLSRAQDEQEYAQAAAVVVATAAGAAQSSPVPSRAPATATNQGNGDAGTGGGRGTDPGFDDDDELDLTGFGVVHQSQSQQARGTAVSTADVVLRHDAGDSSSGDDDVFGDDGFGDDDEDDGAGGGLQSPGNASGGGDREASIDSDGITDEMMANMQELWI